MYSIQTLAVIFMGGGIGASLRYILSQSVNNLGTRIWPGTLLVNILGCTLFFIFSKFGIEGRQLSSFYKVGILGSLTTFSTFSFEVVSLFKSGQLIEGFIVIFLNMFFGIIIGVGILN